MLPQRLLPREGLELADHLARAPGVEVRRESFLEGLQTQFLETGDLTRERLFRREVCERRTVPQAECVAEQPGRAVGLAVRSPRLPKE